MKTGTEWELNKKNINSYHRSMTGDMLVTKPSSQVFSENWAGSTNGDSVDDIKIDFKPKTLALIDNIKDKYKIGS